MKILKIIIGILLFLTVNLFSQEKIAPCRELFLRLKDAGSSSVTFTASTYQTTRWDNQGILTSGFITDQITLSGDTPINEFCKYGFSFNDDCFLPPESIELGRNVYTITTNAGSASFSYDANGCNFLGDVYITYDYNDDIFYQGGSCSSLGNTPISSYTGYSGIWCLELYLTLTNQNGHPYINWNPYHSSNILGYNLYRKVTTGSGSMTDYIFMTNTYYTDEEFTIDPKRGDDIVEYWVKAKISQTELSL